MEILFSEDFQHEYKKIKDQQIRLRIIKQIKKLQEQPESGKPLKHELKGHRTIRIPPFRIVYRLEENKIIILCFDHRKNVYE